MALERLTQITEVGIQSGITLRNVNVEGAYVSGVVTATTLNVTGGGANFAGVVTATSFSGNVTGNINPTTLNVSGVSTFGASSYWGDGDVAYFGDGQDLLIFHNSTDSIIRDNGTGDLNIEGGNRIKLMNPTGIETYAVFNQDGASELYFDNVKRFETTNAGVTVTGTAGVGTALVVTGNARITGILTVGTGSITINPTTDSISGVTTLGVTTAYISAVNDGPLSGARNRIINGDMRIDQRNNGSSVTPTTLTFSVDRWGSSEQTDGSITLQQSGTAPVGFTNSLLVTVTSADSSLGSTQYAVLRQGIEGVNVSDLNWGTSNARPVTLSFWVRSSLTGEFGGAIQNNAQDRSYPFSYTINSANTFEYKTVTIPGDTTGTWLTNNSAGMFVWFNFASGSTYSGTSATWASSLLFAPTGATNLLGTNGATWYLTGVQLEVGTVATPFERRSYTQELALCHRYFHRMNTGRFVMGYKRQDSQCAWFYQSPVPMRVSPTPTLTTGGTFTNFQSNFSTTQSSPAVYDYSLNTGNGVFSVNSTWSSTHTFIPSYEGFDISFSSEL